MCGVGDVPLSMLCAAPRCHAAFIPAVDSSCSYTALWGSGSFWVALIDMSHINTCCAVFVLDYGSWAVQAECCGQPLRSPNPYEGPKCPIPQGAKL